MSERGYKFQVPTYDTFQCIKPRMLDDDEKRHWEQIRATYAIAERLEALVEILDSMRGRHCLNVEAQVTTRGV